MFHRWAALVLVLALCAMSPKNAAGQSTQSPRGHGANGRIGGNYPNPFNPETKLNFSIGATSCAPGTESHVVTMQIVNVLAQVVVVPVLFGPSQTSTTSAAGVPNGTPMSGVRLPCGDYVAFWDGKLADHRREAASGVYGVLLIVDGVLESSWKIYYKK
jgi:hypothetical protein